MYKLIINSKLELEKEFGIKVGSAVCIMPDSKDILTVIHPVKPYFRENREYAFVENYNQALEMIQKLNELPVEEFNV